MSIAIVFAFVAIQIAAADGVPEDAQQLVLVLTADWNATQGSLHTYQRNGDRWERRTHDVPVSIGRAGSAWGIGLHDPQPGLQKEEGDGRSPAGMFAIGTAFGYADVAQSGLSYQAMTRFDYCIDVTDSPLYNRIVDSRSVGQAGVARSTEPMRRDLHAKGDQRYRLGFVIAHNPSNKAPHGSCIFAHLWGSKGQTTAGCTAMDDVAMKALMSWLDAKEAPIFVLLPIADYQRLKTRWHLPDIAEVH